MDELFSCRNCIQNCGQTLTIGRGAGFCQRFNSVIREPETTTCKYLHRKDLPRFVVDEGVREHASDFAEFSGMAKLHGHLSLRSLLYSEKFAWENESFDPLTNALAQYHKTTPAWVFVESLTGGIDGRRSVAHACLVRRYMENCQTWKSSYRLVVSFLAEVDVKPRFQSGDLKDVGVQTDVEDEALWEVMFVRLSLLQEYGWHAGLDRLLWITDQVNGALSSFDWPMLQLDLAELKVDLTRIILEHAKAEGAYFEEPDPHHREYG